MIKTCRQSGEEYEISLFESTLHQKLGVPSPTLSPKERMRRLTAFNNYLNLYQVTCAGTRKSIVSMFRPNVPFPVYSLPYWWSADWDAESYGRHYEEGINFFDQLLDLRNLVPMPALSINYLTLDNCEYVNGASFSKNCYLSFLCTHSEDCFYCYNVRTCRDCIDCNLILDCELCYDCTFAINCYGLRHSFNCRGCADSYFLSDCVGCRNCFGCVGITQAQYCFFNEQLNKDEYHAKISEIYFDSHSEISKWKTAFLKHQQSLAPKENHLMSCENSYGDFLDNCKNVENSFCSSNLEDCSNCLSVDSANDCADMYTWGAKAELVYCCSRSGTIASNIKFSFLTMNNCSNLEYCMMCSASNNCFGCIGLKNKNFHILNKEYSESEYYRLKDEIISGMSSPGLPVDERYGEFFPLRLSMFSYNDSDAMLFFPAVQEEVDSLGGRWEEDIASNRSKGSSPDIFPDRTTDFPDSLCGQVIECPELQKAFKITARELNIYKKFAVPVPRTHWLKRIHDRNKLIKLRYQ